MRKLLMATAAMLGASLGMANAALIETYTQTTPVGITSLYGTPTTAAAVSPSPAKGTISDPPPGQVAAPAPNAARLGSPTRARLPHQH
jgi:hypothetical protein